MVYTKQYNLEWAHKKVKEVDLCNAFIEVPYTQGAQVQITQCYLQTTPYLPLPRKHSPDGASHGPLRGQSVYCLLLVIDDSDCSSITVIVIS